MEDGTVNEAINQADAQRAEAKKLLLGMFRIRKGESNGTVERLVDCIISAAILECASLMAIAAQEPKQ